MIEVLEVGLKEMMNNPNLIYVYWDVTGLCNYECDYCDVFRNEQTQDWETKQNIINYLNYLNAHKDLKVLLYGGEPTIDPDFPKIIKNLMGYIRIFTNLSKGLAYWKEITDIRQDMTISASYHINKCQPDVFLEKIMFLMEKTKVKVRVKMMADSRHVEESLEKYKLFKNLYSDSRYECYMDLVLGNSEGVTGAKWKDSDMDWFLPLQEYKTIYLKYKEDDVVKEKEIAWNDMRNTLIESNHYYECMAGVNLLYIESNGDVSLCKSNRHKPLFNVKDEFLIPKEGVVCDFMGFCCEVEFPKKLICRRKVGEQTKVIRNKLF